MSLAQACPDILSNLGCFIRYLSNCLRGISGERNKAVPVTTTIIAASCFGQTGSVRFFAFRVSVVSLWLAFEILIPVSLPCIVFQEEFIHEGTLLIVSQRKIRNNSYLVCTAVSIR